MCFFRFIYQIYRKKNFLVHSVDCDLKNLKEREKFTFWLSSVFKNNTEVQKQIDMVLKWIDSDNGYGGNNKTPFLREMLLWGDANFIKLIDKDFLSATIFSATTIKLSKQANCKIGNRKKWGVTTSSNVYSNLNDSYGMSWVNLLSVVSNPNFGVFQGEHFYQMDPTEPKREIDEINQALNSLVEKLVNLHKKLLSNNIYQESCWFEGFYDHEIINLSDSSEDKIEVAMKEVEITTTPNISQLTFGDFDFVTHLAPLTVNQTNIVDANVIIDVNENGSVVPSKLKSHPTYCVSSLMGHIRHRRIKELYLKLLPVGQPF